ncbi:unnamed protein product [Ilex paraguariensis]|uniref:Uncharacterized protein n=1 Tax=Ilex paraguariensis TaxID=185542 RepID=A0ABC8US89_9AQUA
MVAISLYRGNLHKAPDVPRRWLVPTPKISLKNFKILLHRRAEALSRLRSTSSSYPNPNPNPSPNVKQEEDLKPIGNSSREPPIPEPCPPLRTEEIVKEEKGLEVKEEKGLDCGDCEAKPVGGSEPLVEDKHVVVENKTKPAEEHGNSEDVKAEAPVNPSSETNKKGDALNDKEKRKREIEDKLQILNEKKHNLVQMLKQILNAEEELKRRSSVQGMAVRPPVPLLVDVTNDSGSMSRHATSKMGSEANLGDMEVGEADDISNHNMYSRNLLRMSSISPSSDSPYRRPAYNMLPHPSRTAFAVAGSPSRFAPPGQQGHASNLPTVSMSGTNYVASSPSPAASGGTSAFRDARHPSPWN